MIVNVQRIDKQNKGLTNRTKEINRKTNNRNCRYYKIQKGIWQYILNKILGGLI